MSSNNLKQKYQNEIRPKLAKEFGLANLLAVPKVEKVVINTGVGEGAHDKNFLEAMIADLAQITGQRPRICRAKQAISGFKLQEGSPIGLMVTIRGARMYDFLEKLFRIILPRLRDFQGVSAKSFDGQGNYTLGLSEQTIFPEVDYDKVNRLQGLEVTIVTNAGSDQKAKRLLEEMGMPFAHAQGSSRAFTPRGKP